MMHRIEMGDIHESWQGLWADIRPFPNFAADQRLEMVRQGKTSLSISAGAFDQMMAAVAEAGDDKDARREALSDSQIDVPWGEGGNTLEYTVMLIESYVVDWNFTDLSEPPQKLPVGRAGVVHLDMHPQLMEQLIDAMTSYYDTQRIPESELKTSAPA